MAIGNGNSPRPTARTSTSECRWRIDGDKLTGQIKHDGEAVEIKEGMFADDTVSFHVVHEQDGNSLVAKFKGKCEDDAINGKIEVEIGGDTLSFDWNATRDKS